MSDIESLILKNLCENEDYAKKTLPFLEENYFNPSNANDIVFEEIKKFWGSLNKDQQDKWQNNELTPDHREAILESGKWNINGLHFFLHIIATVIGF